MNRFKNNKNKINLKIIISIVLFLIIFTFFHIEIASISHTNFLKEKAILETALNHAIIHSYAINGYYPENLDTIINNYAIIYDPHDFYIDYHPFASNIMPDITIIYLENQS